MTGDKLNGDGFFINYFDCINITIGTFKNDIVVSDKINIKSYGDYYYMGGNFYVCKAVKEYLGEIKHIYIKIEVKNGNLVFYNEHKYTNNSQKYKKIKHSKLFRDYNLF